MVVVDRELSLRALQLDRDLDLRFRDIEVFAIGLKTVRQHLHPERAVRDTVQISFPVRIRFQFQVATFLLALGIDRVKDHCGITDRLAVVVFDDGKIQPASWIVLFTAILLRDGEDSAQNHDRDRSKKEQFPHECHFMQRKHLLSSGAPVAQNLAPGFRRPNSFTMPE